MAHFLSKLFNRVQNTFSQWEIIYRTSSIRCSTLLYFFFLDFKYMYLFILLATDS
jgi:hypothetical protein